MLTVLLPTWLGMPKSEGSFSHSHQGIPPFSEGWFLSSVRLLHRGGHATLLGIRVQTTLSHPPDLGLNR